MNKISRRHFNLVAALLALTFFTAAARADDSPIEIQKQSTFTGLTPPTPIAISGFSPEVERILNFDLTVMGFIQVAPDAAKYSLTGKAGGNVEGQLGFG